MECKSFKDIVSMAVIEKMYTSILTFFSQNSACHACRRLWMPRPSLSLQKNTPTCQVPFRHHRPASQVNLSTDADSP